MVKKLLFTLLLTTLFIPLFGYFNSVNINAEGAYVVSYIEDDGDLEQVERFNDYDSAYKKMKENEDYVVMHGDSLSPYKIIAMNSGLVYSYPYRGNSNTMNIYQNVTDNFGTSGATTYVCAHAEMTYRGTYKYFTSTSNYNYGHGFVKVTLNGFDGYADLEYCDLVPTKYLKKDLPITLGGQSRGKYTSQTSFNIVPRQHYYYTRIDGNYRDLCMEFYENWSYSNSLDPAIVGRIALGVAPDFMKDGERYYSDDGINFYSDRTLKNYVGTYYNYYQFVPLRSYSSIKAETINAFIKKGSGNTGVMLNTGDDFIDNQYEYGVNGAAIAAMGIHESGWGTSNISNGKYNLFGWQAYDANTGAAKAYNSVSECIAAQMGDNLSNYLDVLCSCYYSQSLGNKGGGFVTQYASDPYWAEQIASYYYALDKADNGNNGNLTDYNSVNMALVNSNTAIKASASSSSETLYNTANKYGYQKNLIVNVLEIENGYAKTRLSNPVVNGRVVYPYEELSKGTLISYNKNTSIGYIATDKLTFINNVPEEKIDESKLAFTSYIRDVRLDINGLYIEGVAAIKGLNFDNLSAIKHTLTLVNYDDSNKNTSFICNTSEVQYNLNDGKTYKYVKFSTTIPLSSMPLGSYGLMMKVENGGYSKEDYLLCAEPEYVNLETYKDNVSYRLSCNQLYSYRMEIDICKLDHNLINYSNIHKYSMRQSMITFDAITFNEAEDKLLLNIKGHGFIYYLDYDDEDAVDYNVYLIKEDGTTIHVPTYLRESPTDYAKVLGLSNNLDNICFTSDAILNELESGEYRIIIEMKNVDDGITYIDYVELTNQDAYSFNEYEYGSRTYNINTSKTRSRMSIIID